MTPKIVRIYCAANNSNLDFRINVKIAYLFLDFFSHLHISMGCFKEIVDEDSYYSIKISIFSFMAGLVALHKASTI